MGADIRLPFEFPDTPEKVQANFQALYDFISNVEAKTEAFSDLKVDDGVHTKFETDSGGFALQPVNPSFQAYCSGDVSITLTGGIVTVDTEDYDLGNNFDTSTYTFTAPVDGTYIFTFSGAVQISKGSGAPDTATMEFRKNGSTVLSTSTFTYSVSGYLPYSLTCIAVLVANDTIDFYQEISLTTLNGGSAVVSANSRLSGALVN